MNNKYLHLIVLLMIILFISIFAISSETYRNKKLLFPVRNLDRECREKGYSASFMPMSCIKKNGYFSNHRNCKCIDKDGFCAICYPKIVKHGMNVEQNNNKFGSSIFKNN